MRIGGSDPPLLQRLKAQYQAALSLQDLWKHLLCIMQKLIHSACKVMKSSPRLDKATPLVLQYDATRLSAALFLERLNEPPIGALLLLCEDDGKSLSLSHQTKGEPVDIPMDPIHFGHGIRRLRYMPPLSQLKRPIWLSTQMLVSAQLSQLVWLSTWQLAPAPFWAELLLLVLVV